ncbi:hypothetical protein [Streptomyces pseudovenezuelae]
MTAQPRIGSVRARRIPDYPQNDRDFLEYMLDCAKPVTGDDGTAY